jgi:hypothetical protein
MLVKKFRQRRATSLKSEGYVQTVKFRHLKQWEEKQIAFNNLQWRHV